MILLPLESATTANYGSQSWRTSFGDAGLDECDQGSRSRSSVPLIMIAQRKKLRPGLLRDRGSCDRGFRKRRWVTDPSAFRALTNS